MSSSMIGLEKESAQRRPPNRVDGTHRGEIVEKGAVGLWLSGDLPRTSSSGPCE